MGSTFHHLEPYVGYVTCPRYEVITFTGFPEAHSVSAYEGRPEAGLPKVLYIRFKDR